MRSALVIVVCLIAAACSAARPDLRPLESGFGTRAGVMDPYDDGKRQLAAGRYDLAAQRFAQALADDRRSLDALNGLAIAYTRLGRFEVAQAYFERALQADPTSASTLNNYGWSLIEQGRLRHGEPFLELALHRAAGADVPVVAANLESIRRAEPPALVAALVGHGQREAASGHRLVRLTANVYRLETVAWHAEDAGATGSTQVSATQPASAASALALDPQFGPPMEIPPEPAPESVATQPGQRT